MDTFFFFSDCTSKSTDGQRFDFTTPTNAPIECGTSGGCTLGWFWSPRLSGGCETYMNCFDVTITGATGGMKTTAPQITTPIQTCVRVNTKTMVKKYIFV